MKKTILIADDSSTVRKFVVFCLKLKNYNVIAAEDGMDAMEKMSQTNIDLAIVDLNMPNMDGFEFISAIRDTEDFKNLPIIILSSERGVKTKEQGHQLGANTYLEKPFDAKKLQFEVAKIFGE